MAGISGFREPFVSGRNPSADVLYRWAEKNHFVWLITEDILDEYKEVLKRLRVRPNLIGKVVNLIRERPEEVKMRSSIEISPDPKDDPFCLCAEQAKADFILTLNPKDSRKIVSARKSLLLVNSWRDRTPTAGHGSISTTLDIYAHVLAEHMEQFERRRARILGTYRAPESPEFRSFGTLMAEARDQADIGWLL